MPEFGIHNMEVLESWIQPWTKNQATKETELEVRKISSNGYK